MKKKKSDKLRILLNTGLVLGATIFDKGVFFIINIVIARYLAKELFGEYSTALSFATFFSTLTSIGINQTLIRSINLEKHHESEHFGNALFVKTILAIAAYSAMIITLVVIFFTSDKYSINTIYLIIILGVVRLGNEYLSVFYSLYDSKEKFVQSTLFNFSFSILFLAGTLFVVFYKGNYFHFAFARLAVVVIIIAAVLTTTLRKFKVAFDRSTLKGFVKSGMPFAIHGILGNVRQRLSVIFLSLIEGTTATGIYNNGLIFLQTLAVLPFNINRVIIPYLYKISYEKERNTFQFAFDIFSKFFAIISFYIFLVFFLFADSLIVYIFSSKYAASISVLKVLAFGIPFMFNFSITILIVMDKQKYNMIFNGVATAVNIISSIILILLFKSEGNAAALVLANFVAFMLGHYYLFSRKLLSIKSVFFVYCKLTVIVAACCVLYMYYMQSMFFLISLPLISLLFLALTAVFLINKDDIRIVKETFGIGKKK